MADYQENVSSCLRFYDLTDREFHAMVGSWQDRRHDLDLYDLLSNPNKFDECHPDLMLNTLPPPTPNPPCPQSVALIKCL